MITSRGSPRTFAISAATGTPPDGMPNTMPLTSLYPESFWARSLPASFLSSKTLTLSLRNLSSMRLDIILFKKLNSRRTHRESKRRYSLLLLNKRKNWDEGKPGSNIYLDIFASILSMIFKRPLSLFILSNLLSTSLHSASITSSFVLYLFSCFTAGISRYFDGRNLSLTQPINLSLPSMLPQMTFSFISIPADTLLQIASQYNFLPSLLPPPYVKIIFKKKKKESFLVSSL